MPNSETSNVDVDLDLNLNMNPTVAVDVDWTGTDGGVKDVVFSRPSES